MKKLPTIFISYRREDTGGDAGRLNDTLTQVLGPGRIFWDLEKIAPGKDFRNELKRVLSESSVLFVLIGPKWETITDANGRPRLFNKDDLVRMELLAGLRHRSLRVVPVLLNRETVPKASDVPSVLRSVITFWIATAHSTAATTEGNSSRSPSPVVLTMRPPWSATIGRAASR